jgi:hypothetical protein
MYGNPMRATGVRSRRLSPTAAKIVCVAHQRVDVGMERSASRIAGRDVDDRFCAEPGDRGAADVFQT